MTGGHDDRDPDRDASADLDLEDPVVLREELARLRRGAAGTPSPGHRLARIAKLLRRSWHGTRTIARNASIGQLVVLLVFGGLGTGTMVLLLGLLSDLDHNVGLVVLLLAFVGVVALGVLLMVADLLETPAVELEFSERPLPMSFRVLSPGVQAIVLATRDADDKIRTWARSWYDVQSVMIHWVAPLQDTGAQDRRTLEEAGIAIEELQRAIRCLRPETSQMDARALLRSVEARILGDGAEHPMRRGGRA